MHTHFTFVHFKKYAQYLLHEQLPSLSQVYLELLYRAKVPILKLFENMPEERQLLQSRKSQEQFLTAVVEDKSLELAYRDIELWERNQTEGYNREQIRSADLTLIFSVRRKLFLTFLPQYTADVALGVDIMQEFEDFTAMVSQKAFEIYDKIQLEEIKKERNLLESVINNSVDGILAFDQDLKILAFNKVLEEHNGLKQADILGKNVFEVFSGYENTEEGNALLKTMEGNHVFLQNRPFRKKKGFYDINLLPLLNAAGKIQGGVSIVHDITDRKQHEDELHEKSLQLQTQRNELQATVEELRASNEELSITRNKLQEINQDLEERIHHRTEQLEYQRQWLYNLFMQVPGLIGILSGEEGTVVLFNEAFSKLWGGRQVLGLPMEQAWPELVGQGYFEDVRAVLKNGKTITRLEYPSVVDRNNDGHLQQAYINYVYLPYLNPKGEAEGVIIYGVDVTEQVEARRKIEQSEETLKLALESGQMGAWEYNPVTQESNYSTHFNAIFGYSQPIDNWNYDLWMKHIDPEYKDYVVEQFTVAQKNGRLAYDAKINTTDGQTRWIAVRGKVFFSENKKPLLYAGVVQDITDRKEAEEALKKSHEELTRINTDLDNFIYTASHDLRAPIVNLESLIALLNRGLKNTLGQEHEQLLAMMTTSIARLKRTIDALTDITRIQKEDELQEIVVFEDLIQEVKLDLENQLQESNAQMELELKVTSIEFVPHNLRSILYNLLSNAVKYRKPEQPLHIKISTCQEGKCVVLSIQDNGLGISSANQKKLFSMFKRFHSHVKGSGIGLYLIKRIIENVGGKIEAESEEGVGSTFRLYFPEQ